MGWSSTDGPKRVDPCCGHGDKTDQHAALHCPLYAVMRAQLREQLVCEVGEEKVRSSEELDDEQQYQALLSDWFWGLNVVVVNELV
jgi:hypothetical protein